MRRTTTRAGVAVVAAVAMLLLSAGVAGAAPKESKNHPVFPVVCTVDGQTVVSEVTVANGKALSLGKNLPTGFVPELGVGVSMYRETFVGPDPTGPWTLVAAISRGGSSRMLTDIAGWEDLAVCETVVPGAALGDPVTPWYRFVNHVR